MDVLVASAERVAGKVEVGVGQSVSVTGNVLVGQSVSVGTSVTAVVCAAFSPPVCGACVSTPGSGVSSGMGAEDANPDGGKDCVYRGAGDARRAWNDLLKITTNSARNPNRPVTPSRNQERVILFWRWGQFARRRLERAACTLARKDKKAPPTRRTRRVMMIAAGDRLIWNIIA
jgi:hypothetical protein